MGLFSSSYKYFAHAGSSPLFEEGDFPYTTKFNILSAATQGGMSISDGILAGMNTDYFARTKAMMRYASRENNGYVRGFPYANQTFIRVDDSDIIAAINRELGLPDTTELTLTWKRYGTIDEKFIVYKEIADNWLDPYYFDWTVPPLENIWCETFETIQIPAVDPDTNSYYETANVPDFVRVFEDTPGFSYEDLQNMEPEERALLEFFEEHDMSYNVSWDYAGPDGAWQIKNPFNLARYVDTSSWLQVRYTLPGDDCIQYWTYEVNSGVDPLLEASIDREQVEQSFLPVAILMQDKVWFNEDPNSDLAITTNRLLKRMNMNGDTIREDFETQEESGENQSDGAEKWDFFIHFAVPIHTKYRGSMEYLYYFFLDQQEIVKDVYEDYQAFLAGTRADQPITELAITEGYINGYNVRYRWSYIHKAVSIGEKLLRDNYNPDIHRDEFWRNKQVDIQLYDRKTLSDEDYRAGIDSVHGGDSLIGNYGEDPDVSGYHDYMVITRQYRKNANLPDGNGNEDRVVRVLVMGLSMAYQINTSDNTQEGYRFRYAEPLLFGDDEETKEFRIPINFGSLKKVPALHREEAVVDGCTGTVFLVERQEVKWYQSGFFKWLIILIAVVLIVVSIMFPGWLMVAAEFLGAALAGGAVLATYFIYSVLAFAVGFVISFAGGLIGGIAGTLFTIIGSYIALNGLSNPLTALRNSWNSMLTSNSWGSAMSFLSLTASYANTGLQVYSSYALDKLESEMRDFEKTAKEKMQQLQDAWDTLGDSPSWLDPMDLVNMIRQVSPYESPESFYSRTLNTNPGVLGYDLVYNFPEYALSLPEDGQERNPIMGMFNQMARQRGAA